MFSTIPFFITNASSGGGPAPGPWTPADLPGIENWFLSDTGITLSGSNVTAWQDSLTSKSVTQATSVNQPTFTASNANFNGLPTVNFSNSSTPSSIFLQNNSDFSYSGTFPLYIFMVVRKTATTGSAYDFSGGGSDANIGGGAWSINIADAGVNGYSGAIGGFSNSVSGTTLATTLLAGLGLTSTNLYTYFNGNSTAKAGSYTPNANPLFYIGGYDPGGYFNFYGSIAEVIITRGTELSGTDLSNLWTYVQTKYGI
jgi:hypothetical protein